MEEPVGSLLAEILAIEVPSFEVGTVVVVGHRIQQIDLQSCLWSAEQGKNEFSLSPFAP